MTTLPPLPLIDGHLLLDNSAIELMRCPRLFELQHLRRRVLATSKAGRNFGSTLHSGWAVRYRQCSNKAVTAPVASLIEQAMRDWLASNPQPLEDFRNFDHACKVMQAYNSHYGDERFEILKNPKGEPIVENSFAFPFGEVNGVPVIYTGKIDLGIEDSNGIWSQDHKTAFQFGDSWEKQMQMDGGQLGYCWALKKATGLQPNGYVIDGVRIRRPKKQDEYTGVAPCDATDLVRMPVWVTQDNLDEWYEDTTKVIETILFHYKNNFFPRHRWHCVGKYGPCDMYDTCSVSRENRQAALDSGLYEQNTWSPLNKIQE